MLEFYTKDTADILLAKLRDRAENVSADVLNTVAAIISDVRKDGDAALRMYTERFDGVSPESFFLSDKEKKEYTDRVPEELKRSLRLAASNIRAFSGRQIRGSVSYEDGGKRMGERLIPLKRVGIYVPGGTAAYPSSVLMNAIPARTAGVEEIIMVTPPKSGGINPAVVYAAELAGVDRILTVGGAQAVAALAYGTESIPKVDKIVGPGNIFVAMAKKLVFGTVDIDMIAGPSEILIIADSGADPEFVAADLLSQAEHDRLAAAILLSDSEDLARAADAMLERQIGILPRADIASESIRRFGSAVIMPSLEECAELSDLIAPEHLELAVRDPESLLVKVRNAGSVFLGDYTPEPLGDYFAGPNHVLPTNGTARFASPLSVDAFMKRSQYLSYSKDELLDAGEHIIRLAESEGLGAHARSVRIRMEKNGR